MPLQFFLLRNRTERDTESSGAFHLQRNLHWEKVDDWKRWWCGKVLLKLLNMLFSYNTKWALLLLFLLISVVWNYHCCSIIVHYFQFLILNCIITATPLLHPPLVLLLLEILPIPCTEKMLLLSLLIMRWLHSIRWFSRIGPSLFNLASC